MNTTASTMTEAELPSVRSEPLLDELRLLYGVLAYAPELNPSNIDHDDACALNAAMLEAFGLCRSILNRIASNAPRDLRGDSRVTVHADVGAQGGHACK